LEFTLALGPDVFGSSYVKVGILTVFQIKKKLNKDKLLEGPMLNGYDRPVEGPTLAVGLENRQ